jgi:hypothetical protein
MMALCIMASNAKYADGSEIERLLASPSPEELRSLLFDSAYDGILIGEPQRVLSAIRSGSIQSSVGLHAGSLIIERCEISWEDYSYIFGFAFNAYWEYCPQAGALACTKFLMSLPPEISDEQAFALMRKTGWRIPEELLRQRASLKIRHGGVRMSPFHTWKPE